MIQSLRILTMVPHMSEMFPMLVLLLPVMNLCVSKPVILLVRLQLDRQC